METAQRWIVLKVFQDGSHSSLMLYRTLQLQPEFKYAQYISESKYFADRRMLSKIPIVYICVLTQDGEKTVITLTGKTGFV